jgi:hypothetical protein
MRLSVGPLASPFELTPKTRCAQPGLRQVDGRASRADFHATAGKRRFDREDRIPSCARA